MDPQKEIFLNSFKQSQLKKLCRIHGEKVSGRRDCLIQRLLGSEIDIDDLRCRGFDEFCNGNETCVQTRIAALLIVPLIWSCVFQCSAYLKGVKETFARHAKRWGMTMMAAKKMN